MRLAHLLDERHLEMAPGAAAWTPHQPLPSASNGLSAASAGTVHTPTQAGASGVDLEFDAVMSSVLPCRSHDPELWFAEHTAQVEQAKALCRTCPLREGCLAGALERAEPWGVWGGEVFVDGAIVARKRGRGRPRKSESQAA
ncbi:WhiB family transcriptional regulator [Xylanimonas ulmi]|uniref:Transcriptional regulator WhiB n=1 Tax=Xylanimonas ulmi TaxID=228973 RepID=A0A4Q7LZF1_9MICO|nr:WhiB family transcriptional regulator [Xylanibacterium ulmi]RZS59777.1 WhiB family redox-sensing transcriptional regulator [Xylanibacterium ulmi]